VSGSPQEIAAKLTGLMAALGYGLLLLVPLFCAGERTPLDLRWRTEAAPRGYSQAERLFGYSLYAGQRYLLLMAMVAVAVVEAGLALWGPSYLTAWWRGVTACLLPILAAVWAYGVLARLTPLVRWPRSSAGKKIVALVAIIVVNLALNFALLPGYSGREPTATGEFLATMHLWDGVSWAFPESGARMASPAMQALERAVPVPLVTAAWYVLGGLALLALEAVLKRRKARRAGGPGPPAAPPEGAEAATPGPDPQP
jgi:hypothetical protein